LTESTPTPDAEQYMLSRLNKDITMAAVSCFEEYDPAIKRQCRTRTAALMRKVMPINGKYEMAGWAEYEVGVRI